VYDLEHMNIKRCVMPISIFSFFSGVGMLDLGFETAGYNIEFVNEYKREFLNSYIYAREQHNMRRPRFGYDCCDINELLVHEKTLEIRGYMDELRREGNIIGFIGGPPCPDFSVGGKNRGRDGENGRLAQSYINIISLCQPDFFVFENVKGLVKTEKHRIYFEELKEQLKTSGYSLSESLLNSLSFGVPQDRDRIMLLGILRNESIIDDSIRDSNEFKFGWLDNANYNVEDIKNLNWPSRQKFINNGKRKFKYEVPIELTVQYWFEINDIKHHPNRNDFFCVRAGLPKMQRIDEGDTSRKSFKRLHRWRYSPTAAYGNNEVHLHPYKVRRLSVAEAMAIQSLPEWFELPMEASLSAKFKMVGNGVPYLMAYNIAKSIYKYIMNRLEVGNNGK
jgi:DNA (cytosine-5)-methyltransferase 1